MSILSGGPIILRDLFSQSHLEALAWSAFHPGIEIHRLYGVPGGASAALLRYAPGARLPRHIHPGYEHILILAGSQTDDSGNHPVGSLMIHPPGSAHTISSPAGCIVLAFWEKAVRFPPSAAPASAVVPDVVLHGNTTSD